MKSISNTSRPRRTGPGHSGGEVPKVVAEGVRVAVRPDPRTVTVRGIRPGLSLRGLDRNEIPVVDWLCACGHHERARGRSAVIELTTRARVQQCPHTTPAASGRAAA
ncbi:hypothetical protein OG244_19305 [Streptomyces brevispora]|uniref:hypothetical protein n=1 Tax=Streptomyces brevispora TaxID=887462 RepID=UPI002E2F79D0|nr:hypothetical protein [Streptomyces brevispora]